jgi:hypothetical protein
MEKGENFDKFQNFHFNFTFRSLNFTPTPDVQKVPTFHFSPTKNHRKKENEWTSGVEVKNIFPFIVSSFDYKHRRWGGAGK